MPLRLSLVAGLLSVVILCFSTKTISAEKSIVDAFVDIILAYGLDTLMKVSINYLDKEVPGTKCVLGGLKDAWQILKKMECTDYFECKLNMDKFYFRKVIRSIISRCGEAVVRKFVLKASILASKQLFKAYYIGMAADIAQNVLERYNFTITGKVVGAIGNTVSGGMYGGVFGGSIGALGGVTGAFGGATGGMFVGAVIGFGLWAASEMEILMEMLEVRHDIAELQSMYVSPLKTMRPFY